MKQTHATVCSIFGGTISIAVVASVISWASTFSQLKPFDTSNSPSPGFNVWLQIGRLNGFSVAVLNEKHFNCKRRRDGSHPCLVIAAAAK